MADMDTVEVLAAHEAIRQTANRYCRGVDRLDANLMKSAYWPDAIDDHGVFVGNAMEFCDRVVATHGRFLATMHCIYNHSIEVDANAGTGLGEIYNVSYMLRDADDGVRYVDTWWGRYVDRYERRDGEWRIIHRVCVHEWTRSDELSASMPIAWERFRQGNEDRGR
jgi:hypothetical protein